MSETPVLDAVEASGEPTEPGVWATAGDNAPAGRPARRPAPVTSGSVEGSRGSYSSTQGDQRGRVRGTVGPDGLSGDADLRTGDANSNNTFSSGVDADGTATRGVQVTQQIARRESGERSPEAIPQGGSRDPRSNDDSVRTPASETMTMTGSLTGGASYSVGRPTPRNGGGYTMTWRIDLNVGGTGSAAGSSTLGPSGTAALGPSARGRLQGTEVYDDLSSAIRVFEHFTPVGDAIVASQVASEGLRPDWRAVDIGTQRGGSVSLTMTASASTKMARYFSLSLQFAPSAAAAVSAKKTSASEVELTSKVTGTLPASVAASGPGVGVSVGETAEIELEWKIGVDISRAGRPTPLQDMYREIFTPPIDGGREISHEIKRSVGDTASASLPGIRGSGADTVERVRTASPDGEGGETVRERVRGRHEEAVDALGGQYAHSTTVVDLNAQGGSGYAQTRVAADDADSSQDMLSRALTGSGGDGRAGDGEASGTWVVHRTFTPNQLTRIYAALERLGEGDDSLERAFERHTLDALDELARMTGALPRDSEPSTDARRAELLAGYIAETGRQGIDLLESVAGLRTQRRVMLYSDGQRDPVFTSQRDEAELDRRIRGFEAAENPAEECNTEARQLYDELSTRYETLQDSSRYPDLPRAYRNDLASRYGQWIVRLEAVLGAVEGNGPLHYGWMTAVRERLDEVKPIRDRCDFAREAAARRHFAWADGTGTTSGQPIVDSGPPQYRRSVALMRQVWSQANSTFEHDDRRLRDLDRSEGIELADPEIAMANVESDLLRMRASLAHAQSQFETIRRAYQVFHDSQGGPRLEAMLPDRAPEEYRADPMVLSAARLDR